MAVITARRALCARPVAAQLIPQHGRLIALNVGSPPRDIEGELRHREANGLAKGHMDKSGQARSGTQSPWPLHRSLTCLLPTPVSPCLSAHQAGETNHLVVPMSYSSPKLFPAPHPSQAPKVLPVP